MVFTVFINLSLIVMYMFYKDSLDVINNVALSLANRKWKHKYTGAVKTSLNVSGPEL